MGVDKKGDLYVLSFTNHGLVAPQQRMELDERRSG